MTGMWKPGPSSLVAIPAIAWATSLNRTTLARAKATADTTHFASMLQLVHFDFFVTKCVGNVDAFCIKLKFLVQNVWKGV